MEEIGDLQYSNPVQRSALFCVENEVIENLWDNCENVDKP